jgi:hypothetical protein
MVDFSKGCERCGERDCALSVSYMNTDQVCLDCNADERRAPGYEAAKAAEIEAVRNGDYNFPGVGLSEEDERFLERRRAERKLRGRAR